MSKKSKITIICIIVVLVIMSIMGYIVVKRWNTPKFSVDNTNGYIEVICKGARKGCGGGTYIGVSKGEKLVVESKLSEGAIILKLNKNDKPGALTVKDILNLKNEDNIFEINKEIKGIETFEIEVENGQYYGFCETSDVTTGKLRVYVK